MMYYLQSPKLKKYASDGIYFFVDIFDRKKKLIEKKLKFCEMLKYIYVKGNTFNELIIFLLIFII